MNIFERLKKNDSIGFREAKQSYGEVTSTARVWIKGKSEQEQILILNYIIDVLIEDICSSSAADVLKKPLASPFFECIPYICTDETNNTVNVNHLTIHKLFFILWKNFNLRTESCLGTERLGLIGTTARFISSNIISSI